FRPRSYTNIHSFPVYAHHLHALTEWFVCHVQEGKSSIEKCVFAAKQSVAQHDTGLQGGKLNVLVPSPDKMVDLAIAGFEFGGSVTTASAEKATAAAAIHISDNKLKIAR